MVFFPSFYYFKAFMYVLDWLNILYESLSDVYTYVMFEENILCFLYEGMDRKRSPFLSQIQEKAL
jgi:hypothetical protein